MPTDEQCIAAIDAMNATDIQGFGLGQDFCAPYVVRDFMADGKEIWRGNMHIDMMRRIQIEKMKAALTAVGL